MAQDDERLTIRKRDAERAEMLRQEQEAYALANAEALVERERLPKVRALLHAGLPLFREHVEMSPINLERRQYVGATFWNRVGTGEVKFEVLSEHFGWPIYNNSGGYTESDGFGTHWTEYLLLTEDGQVGLGGLYGQVGERRYQITVNKRGPSLRPIDQFEQYGVGKSQRGLGPAPITPEHVTAGIEILLAEVGLHFKPPATG